MSSEEISPDPFASIAKGITDSVLEKTGNKIKEWAKELAKRFIDKDYFFVEDDSIIAIAKKQRKKSEFGLFNTYIKDKDKRILFQMGLSLRELEKDKKDFEPLKIRIKNKYGWKGLHFAHFVQNGLFSKYMGSIIEESQTEEIKSKIEYLFENIENTVVFVNNIDNSAQKAKEIITKIYAHSPDTFIISSIGSARVICEETHKLVMKEILSVYNSEIYEKELEGRKIFFLNKIQTTQ